MVQDEEELEFIRQVAVQAVRVSLELLQVLPRSKSEGMSMQASRSAAGSRSSSAAIASHWAELGHSRLLTRAGDAPALTKNQSCRCHVAMCSICCRNAHHGRVRSILVRSISVRSISMRAI
jgi:hypothetical protein